MKLFNVFTTLALSSVLLAVAGTANANPITHYYNYTEAVGAVSGGSVTYASVGNTLTITIDNTTTGPLSSAITGVVFDIDADVAAATVVSFKDGTNTDIENWDIDFDTKGSITPGNTKVDIYFARGNIQDGIYNAANDSTPNTANLVPDVAILTLLITDPAGYAGLTSISNDVLRMQRTGLNGEGSLKLTGYDDPDEPEPDPIPLPGTLLLLGAGLLGLRLTRRRAL